jgi:hypothetical protein
VLVAAAGLVVAFGLRVAGLLVVGGGFGLAGYGLATAIVPARTPLDRLLAALTFAVATLALVAEGLSLAVLLGSTTAWIAGATICGVVGGLLPRRSPTDCCLTSRIHPPPPSLAWRGDREIDPLPNPPPPRGRVGRGFVGLSGRGTHPVNEEYTA